MTLQFTLLFLFHSIFLHIKSLPAVLSLPPFLLFLLSVPSPSLSAAGDSSDNRWIHWLWRIGFPLACNARMQRHPGLWHNQTMKHTQTHTDSSEAFFSGSIKEADFYSFTLLAFNDVSFSVSFPHQQRKQDKVTRQSNACRLTSMKAWLDICVTMQSAHFPQNERL